MRRLSWMVPLVAFGSMAAAQTPAPATPGDSLLAAGSIAAAESTYYARARARPRDPDARFALGRYLAARGAPRVGAVLLEEARQFGADARVVARELAPLYATLGDYKALATLPASPLNNGARAQAAWLVTHASVVAASDGTADSVIVAYRTGSSATVLGRVTLRIGGRPVEAIIDPRRSGIAIRQHAVAPGHLHRFPAAPDEPVSALIDTLMLGGMVMINVPVTIEQGPDSTTATIGLEALRRFAPTFDPRAGRLTLRMGGSVAKRGEGQRIATLTTGGDIRMLEGRRFLSIALPMVSARLRSQRWTLDSKRGAIVIE
jgi:hypothetical protein